MAKAARTEMTIEQLTAEIIKRLEGTNIEVLDITRKCGRIVVDYSYRGMTKKASTADCNLDKNDPAQTIANEIMMREAR